MAELWQFVLARGFLQRCCVAGGREYGQRQVLWLYLNGGWRCQVGVHRTRDCEGVNGGCRQTVDRAVGAQQPAEPAALPGRPRQRP